MESSPGIVMKPSLIKEPVQHIEKKKCFGHYFSRGGDKQLLTHFGFCV